MSIIFVSLGSGDPELITIKGLKALQKADIVLCPSTTNSRGVSSRSKEILLALEIEEAKIKLFDVAMVKERTEIIRQYKKVALQASELYSEGLNVAIVAEGDSGFYSSSQYINDDLVAMNIPTKRIEGIPAFIACGALANIHIVKQNEQLVVVPGITTQQELNEYIGSGKSIVIMKPTQCEDIIKQILESTTENTLIHYFENVGIADKEFYTTNKKEIQERKFPYFSLLIIQNKE